MSFCVYVIKISYLSFFSAMNNFKSSVFSLCIFYCNLLITLSEDLSFRVNNWPSLSAQQEKYICPINLPCNNTYLDQSEVERYCKEKIEAKMVGRCCFQNGTILGLDLRYCDLKILNLTNSVYSSLYIMDLRENNFSEFSKQDFIGLTSLEELYLPYNYSCPGGEDAWNVSQSESAMTECFGQLNRCQYDNISCTSFGECICTGPGSAKCICKSGQHGYKCLNSDSFPMVIFCTSLIVSTVILSIVLWFAQGRDVYKKL